MNELQEMTQGKSLIGLETELSHQLRQGENKGGTICSHIQAEIDKHIAKRYTGKYYVTMNDSFMSGWGKATGKTNKFIIACDTLEQAERVKDNAHKRDEMTYVTLRTGKPTIKKNVLPSWKHVDELGEIWTK